MSLPEVSAWQVLRGHEIMLNGIFGSVRVSGISDGATGIEELKRPDPACISSGMGFRQKVREVIS